MLYKVLAQFKQTFLTKCVSVRFISVSSAFVIWVSEMTGGFDAKRRTSELALVCFSMRHVCSQASFPVTWLRHSDTSLSAWISVGRGVCLHSREKGRRQRVSAGRGWGRREISSSLWERRGRFSPPLAPQSQMSGPSRPAILIPHCLCTHPTSSQILLHWILASSSKTKFDLSLRWRSHSGLRGADVTHRWYSSCVTELKPVCRDQKYTN